MPVTVVVGGQFGSEGKGKVAHWLAGRQGASYAARVGGPNSGHIVCIDGCCTVLRQLPTAVMHADIVGVLPAGAYIDASLLLREIDAAELTPDRLLVHPQAVLIDEGMKSAERDAALVERIGSTAQGVGAAVTHRAMRRSSVRFARDMDALLPFVRTDLDKILDDALRNGQRVIVEGTQGFGLSILHGDHYPFLTSRDTTAAGALSEVGLNVRDVDCVALVLRAFPIRVGGNSGPLPSETTWDAIKQASGAKVELAEFATATGRLRRVANFDAETPKRAIRANRPDLVFLNHVDYFDYTIHERSGMSAKAGDHVELIERALESKVHFLGTGPSCLIERACASVRRSTSQSGFSARQPRVTAL